MTRGLAVATLPRRDASDLAARTVEGKLLALPGRGKFESNDGCFCCDSDIQPGGDPKSRPKAGIGL